MIKVINETVKCTECTKSKMNGFDLICTEFQEVIKFDETLCTDFEKKGVSND